RPEEGADLGQCGQEAPAVLGIVVQIRARSGGGGDSEAAMQRLGAVVSYTHGHALGIEVLSDVMGVDSVDVEGHGPDPRLRVAEDPDAGDLGDAVEQDAGELTFVVEDLLEPHLGEVADGGGE